MATREYHYLSLAHKVYAKLLIDVGHSLVETIFPNPKIQSSVKLALSTFHIAQLSRTKDKEKWSVLKLDQWERVGTKGLACITA